MTSLDNEMLVEDLSTNAGLVTDVNAYINERIPGGSKPISASVANGLAVTQKTRNHIVKASLGL